MSKKLLSFVLSLVIVLSVFSVVPFTAFAATSGKCGNSVNWEYSNGQLIISGEGDMYGYDNATKYVPWYSNRTSINSIIIQYGVTKIGWNAFANCTNLTSVSIADSVTYIDTKAFYGCTRLTTITIPDSVTVIDSWTFEKCTNLSQITMSNNIRSFGDYAFSCCDNLISFYIPASLVYLNNYVFFNCKKLTNIVVAPNNQNYSSRSGVLFNKTQTTLIQYPIGKEEHTFSVPYGVTRINRSAFYYCNQLTSINMPDSLSEIGDHAFNHCVNLKTVIFGNNVTTIGQSLFYDCSKLSRVYLGNCLTEIQINTFYNCSNLFSVTLPETITTIWDKAFINCNNLNSITIPRAVTYVGTSAFSSTALTDVYYNGNVNDRANITIGNSNGSLTAATWHYYSTGPDNLDDPELNTQLGFDHYLNTASVCNCYNGEDTKVTVILKSKKFDIGSLSFSISDKSIAVIKTIIIGEGDYFTSENEKKAAIYLNPKKVGSTTLTATAPNGVKATCTIIVAAKQNSEQADAIANQISNVNMGPFAIKGATITVAGYEIPLITLESTIKMDLGNLKIISNGEEQTIQVLLGFDQKASANIDGERNSTAYWSESYKEVKSMYQSLTGKKVSTTRLWNKYSSLRGKLKKNNANMVINVSSDLTGYVEFKKTGDSYVFSEGGVMASFSANTSLRSYYGPAYVALGLGVDANGSLAFKYENNKVNPQITVNPSFTVSAGGGIGTRTTYAEIDAYGTLGAEISSAANDPFKAYLDLGVKWSGYIIGKEIFSGSKSFVKTQLYPDFGKNMRLNATASTGADFSDMDYYSDMLNSSHTISREYLKQSKMSNRKSIAATGSSPESGSVDFERTNTYPLSQPSLVGFDDGTALLVWIDDSGEKSDNNMCSLYYSFFSGRAWTEPAVLYENGTANDMPSVYSDGTYAYIVWQRADQVFPDNISVADMMMHFDLYESTFDSEDQSFTEPVLINSDPNTAFEFNPQICGSKGSFTVSWIENSDNNIMQLSGKNTLKTAGFTAAGEMTVSHDIASTDCIVSKTVLTFDGIYYCIQTDEGARLYSCFDNTIAEIGEVQDFAVANGKLFCLKDGAVCIGSDEQEYEYANLTGLNNFSITGDGESMYLFTLVLNEDFTKSLYYSVYDQDNDSWSALECYHKGGAYIRNYSPAIIGGKIFAAYNLVNDHPGTGSQQASLIVDGKTSDIDIQLNYIDFSDESIDDDNVILNFEVKNNSSQVITGIRYFVVDENDAIIDSGATRCDLGAFGTATGSIVTDKLDDQRGKQFSVKILPDEYTDYDLSNNIVSSTFEAIPDYQEVYILGDADGDGLITILDATVIQRYLASYTVLTPEYVVKCGDVNGEGVDILDATNIQLYLASFTVPYEIGKPIT